MGGGQTVPACLDLAVGLVVQLLCVGGQLGRADSRGAIMVPQGLPSCQDRLGAPSFRIMVRTPNMPNPPLVCVAPRGEAMCVTR